MYQKSIMLLSKKNPNKESLSYEYLALLEKVMNLVKRRRRDLMFEFLTVTMCEELPSYCSFYYLELAFLIKKADKKISALASIFENLSDEEKCLVRQEIKEQFKLIKDPDKRWIALIDIAEIKDEELTIFCQSILKTLPIEGFLVTYLLLQDLTNFSSDPVTVEKLQRQQLAEIINGNSAKICMELANLFNRELLPTVKEEAVSYAIKNWSKLKCHLSERIDSAGILEYLPSEFSEREWQKLYSEIEEYSQYKDKSKFVELLISLASESNETKQKVIYNKVLCVIRSMNGKDHIASEALYGIEFNNSTELASELASELAYSLIEKYKFFSDLGTLINLLISFLDHVSPSSKEVLAEEILSLMRKEKVEPDVELELSLRLVKYLPLKKRSSFVSYVLGILLERKDEKQKATSLVYVAEYLDKNKTKLVMSAIEQIESLAFRSIALANILPAFEGRPFISLAEKILDSMNSLPNEFHDLDVEHLTLKLVTNIGKKLN